LNIYYSISPYGTKVYNINQSSDWNTVTIDFYDYLKTKNDNESASLEISFILWATTYIDKQTTIGTVSKYLFIDNISINNVSDFQGYQVGVNINDSWEYKLYINNTILWLTVNLKVIEINGYEVSFLIDYFYQDYNTTSNMKQDITSIRIDEFPTVIISAGLVSGDWISYSGTANDLKINYTTKKIYNGQERIVNIINYTKYKIYAVYDQKTGVLLEGAVDAFGISSEYELKELFTVNYIQNWQETQVFPNIMQLIQENWLLVILLCIIIISITIIYKKKKRR
jgi:hypothetical protein